MSYKIHKLILMFSTCFILIFSACNKYVTSDPTGAISLRIPSDVVITGNSAIFTGSWDLPADWVKHTFWAGIKKGPAGAANFQGYYVESTSGSHNFSYIFTEPGDYYAFAKYSKDNTPDNTKTTPDKEFKVYKQRNVILLQMAGNSLDESIYMKYALEEGYQEYIKNTEASKSNITAEDFSSMLEAKNWAIANAGPNWNKSYYNPVLCIVNNVNADAVRSAMGYTDISSDFINPSICFVLVPNLKKLLSNNERAFIYAVTATAVHELGHATGITFDDNNGLKHSGTHNTDCVMMTPLVIPDNLTGGGPHFCEGCIDQLRNSVR